jgi:hypothetical protein
MELNQVLFMQSTNTINKKQSTGYTREVDSMSEAQGKISPEASEQWNMLVAQNPGDGGGAQEEIKQ